MIAVQLRRPRASSPTSSPRQRTLQQRTLERVRRVELTLGVEPSHYEPGESPGRATTGAGSGPATGKAAERETVGS